MSEQEIQSLESRFPAVSGQAFAAARQRVLASGQSVLQTEGSRVVRVFPDGRKEVVKAIEEQDIPNLPARVYLRGFLTQIARVLKVDRARLADGYLACVEKLGAPRVAVNCAGIGRAARTISKSGPHDLGMFAQVIQVNLIGTFNVIRLALRRFDLRR